MLLRSVLKRILYLHHGGGIGGAPLSLLYLLQQLNRARYEPVVVTLKPGPVVDLYREEGIETHVEPGISDFSHTTLEWYGGRDWWRLPGKVLSILPSIQRTQALIRQIKPDLVHLNSSTLSPCALGAAREGVPIVWHIREPLAKGILGLRRNWIRHTIDRHAGRVVAISQYDADQLIASDRVRVIYNFVDFDRFDRALSGESVRRELGLPNDAPTVLMLGGVAEPKGTLYLIKALPALLEAVPAARLVIAGPPPRAVQGGGLRGVAKRILRTDAYDEDVIATLKSFPLDMQSAVCFTGIRQDIPALLAAADCLVFPSTVPHFARPIIEAAAMAIPSVASDLGGPRELVISNETGLLVPPCDPECLAEALGAVLSQPEQVHVMGDRAYARARQLFDARQNAAATIALYEELLAD